MEKVARVEKESGIDWRPFTKHAEVPGAILVAMFANDSIAAFSAEEIRIKMFVHNHRDFFYEAGGAPNTRFLRRLWPNINEYVKIHEENQDDWAAWDAMAAELEKYNLKPPPKP